MKQKQEQQRNIIAKLVNNNSDSDNRQFTTIRIARDVYDSLSKRGKATHSDIISKLLSDTGSLLDVPEDQRSW